MGACEDDGCYHIPPPTGTTGPWVLTVVNGVNNNMPYWESVGNLVGMALAAFAAAAKIQAKQNRKSTRKSKRV